MFLASCPDHWDVARFSWGSVIAPTWGSHNEEVCGWVVSSRFGSLGGQPRPLSPGRRNRMRLTLPSFANRENFARADGIATCAWWSQHKAATLSNGSRQPKSTKSELGGDAVLKISAVWRSLLTQCSLLTAVAGCGIITGEQNSLPPAVLQEMNKPEHSGPNHTKIFIGYTGQYLCEQGTTGLLPPDYWWVRL